MNNNLKEIMQKINVPEELNDRSKKGIQEAKRELDKGYNKIQYKRMGGAIILAAALLFLILDQLNLFSPLEDADMSEGVHIPAIELSDASEEESLSMIGLIVYKGNIYTQSDTIIDIEDARKLRGEKLGETKGSIDEWSTQDDYAKEFASSIGEAEVYAVDGYEESFRIMTFSEENDHVNGMFFENLNGLTVTSGEDVFGRLQLKGNVIEARYRSFEEWDSMAETFHSVEDEASVQEFIKGLYKAEPVERTEENDPIGRLRNNESFKELILYLEDGTEISLILLSEGYIYYGSMPVYFEMENDAFNELWNTFEVN